MWTVKLKWTASVSRTFLLTARCQSNSSLITKKSSKSSLRIRNAPRAIISEAMRHSQLQIKQTGCPSKTLRSLSRRSSITRVKISQCRSKEATNCSSLFNFIIKVWARTTHWCRSSKKQAAPLTSSISRPHRSSQLIVIATLCLRQRQWRCRRTSMCSQAMSSLKNRSKVNA